MVVRGSDDRRSVARAGSAVSAEEWMLGGGDRVEGADALVDDVVGELRAEGCLDAPCTDDSPLVGTQVEPPGLVRSRARPWLPRLLSSTPRHYDAIGASPRGAPARGSRATAARG